jgi:hypothetical protein
MLLATGRAGIGVDFETGSTPRRGPRPGPVPRPGPRWGRHRDGVGRDGVYGSVGGRCWSALPRRPGRHPKRAPTGRPGGSCPSPTCDRRIAPFPAHHPERIMGHDARAPRSPPPDSFRVAIRRPVRPAGPPVRRTGRPSPRAPARSPVRRAGRPSPRDPARPSVPRTGRPSPLPLVRRPAGAPLGALRDPP